MLLQSPATYNFSEFFDFDAAAGNPPPPSCDNPAISRLEYQDGSIFIHDNENTYLSIDNHDFNPLGWVSQYFTDQPPLVFDRSGQYMSENNEVSYFEPRTTVLSRVTPTFEGYYEDVASVMSFSDSPSASSSSSSSLSPTPEPQYSALQSADKPMIETSSAPLPSSSLNSLALPPTRRRSIRLTSQPSVLLSSPCVDKSQDDAKILPMPLEKENVQPTRQRRSSFISQRVSKRCRADSDDDDGNNSDDAAEWLPHKQHLEGSTLPRKSTTAERPKKKRKGTSGRRRTISSRVSCPKCSSTFTRDADMMRHCLTVHGQETQQQLLEESRPKFRRWCLGCREVLARVDARKRHEDSCPKYATAKSVS